MSIQTRRLVSASADADKKYLLPLGDIHYGHPNCDKETLQGYLDWTADKEAWILLMGDLIENSSKESVGAGVYEQILQPDQQIDDIIAMLMPHRERILGLLTGNHEERTYKASGVDPSKYIANMLQVPYLRYAAFLRLCVGKSGFTVYATHGGSGASTSSGKLNAIKRLANVAEADLYLMGHVHDLLTETVNRKTLDTRNKKVCTIRRHFVITGSFLEYEDSYSEMKSYQPGKVGAPRIRFDSEKADIHVSV